MYNMTEIMAMKSVRSRVLNHVRWLEVDSHAIAPGLNPVLTSGQDLFPVVPDSTSPRFVNSQLVASSQMGFLIMFLLSLKIVSFRLIKKGSACELA